MGFFLDRVGGFVYIFVQLFNSIPFHSYKDGVTSSFLGGRVRFVLSEECIRNERKNK